ncbi:MAG: NlpC/P60 family protein [Actinomycetota bacterium]
MGVGGAVVATAGVVLGIDTDRFHKGLSKAERDFRDGVSGMKLQLTKLQEAELKAEQASQRYARAVAHSGQESDEARRALVRLSAANRQVADSTEHVSLRQRAFGHHTKTANHELGALTRGGIAGSGMFRSLGRSVAFASGAFLGGVGLIAVLRGSVSGASDLAEQVDKTRIVFGRSQKAVLEWSKDSAMAMGVSREAALKFAGSFGALLRPMGLAEKAAADFSVEMVQTGVDLAAFYNVDDPQDALHALQSGLIGMARPLRQFGILLTADRVKAVAFAEGIAKADVDVSKVAQAQLGLAIANAKLNKARKEYAAGTTQVASAEKAVMAAQDRVTASLAGSRKELTAGEKVLARRSIILHDAALAHDNFALTSGRLAQQQKILHAQIDEVQVVLGQALLPTILRLMKQLTAWIDHAHKTGQIQRSLNDAVHKGGQVVHVLTGVVRALWPVLKTAAHWAGGFKEMLFLLAGAGLALKLARLGDIFKVIRAEMVRTAVQARVQIAATEASAVTGMGVVGTSAVALSATIKAALISTGIGLVVVAFGVAVAYIVTHLNQVKGWFVSFAGFLKRHMVLIATLIGGPFGFVAAEVIRHWRDVKGFFVGFAKFFGTVFTHPVRAIRDAFGGLWRWLKRTALEVYLAILEPFSHLPFGMGKWAQKAKDRVHAQLDALAVQAGKDGANAGNRWGQGFLGPVLRAVARARSAATEKAISAGVASIGGGPQKGVTVATAATAEIGVPYSWGGGGASGPTKGIAQGANTVGFDCSGLVVFAMAQIGIKVPRTSQAQISQAPYHPSIGELLPGDLVGYHTGHSHIAIYIGNGKIVHAPHTGTTVQVTTLNGPGRPTGTARWWGGKTVSGGGGTTGGGDTTVNLGAGGGGGLVVGTKKKPPKTIKELFSLVPTTLRAALIKAEATARFDDDIKVLLLIEKHLVNVIKHTKNINTRHKAVIELARTRAKLAKAKAKAEKEAYDAEIKAIDAANAKEKEKIDKLMRSGGSNWGPDPGVIADMEMAVAVAEGKLAKARLKYAENTTQVASAVLAVNRAKAKLAAALAGGGAPSVGGVTLGEPTVVFDPKTGTYIVTQVAPDLIALKAELKYNLEVVLPTLDKRIRAVKAAIQRLAKHPKKNKVGLARLRNKLKHLKDERTGLIALLSDLAVSIKEIEEALKEAPDAETDTGSAIPVGEIPDTSSESAASDSSSSSGAESQAPTQAEIDALVEQNFVGFLSAQRDLTHSFSSNVLAAAFAGRLGGGTLDPGGGGSTIHVENYFATGPSDPHLFSAALEFELKALIG